MFFLSVAAKGLKSIEGRNPGKVGTVGPDRVGISALTRGDWASTRQRGGKQVHERKEPFDAHGKGRGSGAINTGEGKHGSKP